MVVSSLSSPFLAASIAALTASSAEAKLFCGAVAANDVCENPIRSPSAIALTVRRTHCQTDSLLSGFDLKNFILPSYLISVGYWLLRFVFYRSIIPLFRSSNSKTKTCNTKLIILSSNQTPETRNQKLSYRLRPTTTATAS